MLDGQTEIGTKQLRSFGLMIGSVFAFIGLWPMLIHNFDPRWWGLIVAGLFIIPALTVPRGLKPIYRVWMVIGQAMGWVNTRLILAIGFFGILTPIGLAMRAFGRDPLRCKYEPVSKTYSVTRSPRPGSHMQRQF